MAKLSELPSIDGLTLPGGCTSVKFKTSAPDPSSASNSIDVTTLSDEERTYQTAPLKDADEADVKQTVSVSFFGTAPEVNTDPDATGWVCIESEEEYAVGDFVKGTATYVFAADEE